MCKCSGSLCPGGKCEKKLQTFSTNTPPGQIESVIGAKKEIAVKTPTGTLELQAGTLYRMPKSQARDLIDRAKAPIWIVA